MILHRPGPLGLHKAPLVLVEHPTLSTTCCGTAWICTRVHGASAFGVYETLVETYGKDLANSNRSTPLSESRARNLSSPVFVVRQQYGDEPLRPRFVHAPPRNISYLLQHAAVIHRAFKSC
jgi:hypothetical protein